jgi:tetratricopeptide (TPR) repeat protein
MDQQLYHSLAQRASDLVEAGNYAEALDLLEQIIAGDLPDYDKAMMCLNTAIVHDKWGRQEEALTSYARALDYERRTGSHFVAQHRAAYFSQLGRYDESIRCYEELLRREGLATPDREAFAANLRTLARLRAG